MMKIYTQFSSFQPLCLVLLLVMIPLTPAPPLISSITSSASYPVSGGTTITFFVTGLSKDDRTCAKFGKISFNTINGVQWASCDRRSSGETSVFEFPLPLMTSSVARSYNLVYSDGNNNVYSRFSMSYDPPLVTSSLALTPIPLTGGLSVTILGSNFFANDSFSYGSSLDPTFASLTAARMLQTACFKTSWISFSSVMCKVGPGGVSASISVIVSGLSRINSTFLSIAWSYATLSVSGFLYSSSKIGIPTSGSVSVSVWGSHFGMHSRTPSVVVGRINSPQLRSAFMASIWSSTSSVAGLIPSGRNPVAGLVVSLGLWTHDLSIFTSFARTTAVNITTQYFKSSLHSSLISGSNMGMTSGSQQRIQKCDNITLSAGILTKLCDSNNLLQGFGPLQDLVFSMQFQLSNRFDDVTVFVQSPSGWNFTLFEKSCFGCIQGGTLNLRFPLATASSWPELPVSGCVAGIYDLTNYKFQTGNLMSPLESEIAGRWIVWAFSASQILVVSQFKMEFISSSLLFALGSTSVASISWTSDSVVEVVSAPGVGRNLIVNGTSSGVPVTFLKNLTFSYPAPIASNVSFNTISSRFAAINTGSVAISMIGSFFSSLAASQSLRLITSACRSSTWRSDTLVFCRTPAATSSLTPSLFVVTVLLLQSNLSSMISFLPPFITSIQSGMQHHSTGSRSITILGEFGLALYSRAVSVILMGSASPRTLWLSHSHIQARSVQYGFIPNSVHVTSGGLISSRNFSMVNFIDSFPSTQASLISDSNTTLSFTGSSSILLFGSSFAVAHFCPKIRVEFTSCPSTNWISDSALQGKFMSQALDFQRRSVFISLANRPFVVSSGLFFTYQSPVLLSMNQSNITNLWYAQNGTVVVVPSSLDLNSTCGDATSCPSTTSILSLLTTLFGNINPVRMGLNVSIRLNEARPLLSCVESIWFSDSSLQCRVDKLPQDWSLVAFPTFLFQTLPSSYIFTSQVKNILYEQPNSPIGNSLAITLITNGTIRSHEILTISIFVENNSSIPYANADGYIGVNLSLISISTSGAASITSESFTTSVYLAENTLKSAAELLIVMASTSNSIVPLIFTFVWYTTASPNVKTVVNVHKHVLLNQNGISNFSFIQDVPILASVTVNHDWLSQSPTPQVKITFSTLCESFVPRLIVNTSLLCFGLPFQSYLEELTSSSCIEGSLLLQVQRTWFTSPPIPTTCHFMFSLHQSLTPNSLISRMFKIAVGPPVSVHLLGKLPSVAFRSDDELYTMNSTAGSCIVAFFKDASGFKVPNSGISANLSAKSLSMDYYELGVRGNNSFVSQTNSDGDVSWCGIFTKRIIPSAFLQISWTFNGQSFVVLMNNSSFSVNGSGSRAFSSFKSISNNISVTPGQGVPPMNLTLTDAAGNLFEPRPNTYIRITITSSVSSRRHLLAIAESASTCSTGGPKYVLVTSSDVTVPGSVVFACTAGTSLVQYDVGVLANGFVSKNVLVNGVFDVVSPAVAFFSILVSSGPAVSFSVNHKNSTTFTTFSVIQNAIAVICRDSGRNIVECNFTFTVNASSVMPVSFWPSSIAMNCNQTLVISSQCFISLFSLALISTAFFSTIDVKLIATSATLEFENSAFTLAFAPLCAPGTYVVQKSSNVSSSCANCTSSGFSNISDALLCSTCPAGSAPLNRTGCRGCTGNTYTNQSGSSQCDLCPSNYFAAYSHTECLTFDFVDIPPLLIASDSDTELPCVALASNIAGIVNAQLAQGIIIQISLLPDSVDGITVMTSSVVQVTLQSANVTCQRATVKVNKNIIESLFLPRYAWALKFHQCNNSFCIFAPYISSASFNDQRVVLPYHVSIVPPLPSVDRASTSTFDFIGGTIVTLFGQHFKVFPGSPSIRSSECVFKMIDGSRNITVPADILDPGSGKQILCRGTAVDENTLESGGLFGAPFQKWSVHVTLSDGRRSLPNILIQTQCKNATRYLNASQLRCSRCPSHSFSTQPDAPLCWCSKGSFGRHPVCRFCPLVAGFDCTRDNMTEVAILPGYYLNVEKFSSCTTNKCPALEKCSVPEACPGIPGMCLNTEEKCYTPESPGCGSCCRKFYKDQDGLCLACPKGNYTLIFIIIILVLVVAISVMQSFESPALVSSFKGLLTVMSFIQSFVSLRFLDIDWPPVMKELFNAFRPLTFSLDFVRPECSVDLTPEQKLYGVLFVPISCCIGVALAKFFSVSFWLFRLHLKISKIAKTSVHSLVFSYRELYRCLIISSFGKKLRREIISDFGPFYYALNPLLFINAEWNIGTIADRARRSAFLTDNVKKIMRSSIIDSNIDTKTVNQFPPTWIELRKTFADAELDTEFMRYALEIKKSASGALSVLILSFVGVLETALPILNCSDQVMEDGSTKRFLRGDRSIECSFQDNSVYRSLAAMAITGLLVYAVCMPVLMHIVFRSKWCMRLYRLDYATHNSVFGFVTSRYKRDYLSWEFLNHLKKGSQIAIPLYYASQPVQQSVLLFFLNSIFSIMVLYTMPFSSNFLNIMEIMSSLDLVVTVIVGIFFTVEHKGQPVMSDDAKKFGGFALVFLCAATLVASILCIFNEVVFLAKFHRQPAVSAWLKFFSGNAGDSIGDKSLFSLFCTAIFNKRSSKSIIKFNNSIRNLKDKVSCFRLRSWYALLTYYPTSRMTMPFFRDPVIEMLKDLHHLTRRISELRNVGIFAPEKALLPHMLQTHGAGDPPYQVYQKIAEIDNVLTSSLSAESNRYLLAILVADKFRNKSREDVFTKRYWDRIVPASDSLLDAIARVPSTSERLSALFPAKQGFWARLRERYWPDYSELYSMISVIDSFNQMSPKEHAHFRKLSSDPFLPVELLFCVHSSDDEDSSKADSACHSSAKNDDHSSVVSAGGSGANENDHDDHHGDEHADIQDVLENDDDDSDDNDNRINEGDDNDCDIPYNSDDLASNYSGDMETQPSKNVLQHSSDEISDDASYEKPTFKLESYRHQTHQAQLAPRVSPDNVMRIRASATDSLVSQSHLSSFPNFSSRNAQMSGTSSVKNSSAQLWSQLPPVTTTNSALFDGMKSAAKYFTPAPPPRVPHKVSSDPYDRLVPQQRSISPLSTTAMNSSAAAKARISDGHLERPVQRTGHRFVPATKSSVLSSAAALPPRAPTVSTPPSLQRTNDPNQPAPRSVSPHQTRFADKSATARPRHVMLTSTTELKGAVAVNIPVRDDHKNAKVVFEWPSTTPAMAAVVSKSSAASGAAGKLKAMMSAKRKA